MDNYYNSGKLDLGLEKSKPHVMVKITGYLPDAIATQTIIKKSTGKITVMAFDAGKGLAEATSPFDTFVQVIEGKVEIVIDKVPQSVNTGECIVIPAHSSNFIKSPGRFKIVMTTIKSGYE